MSNYDDEMSAMGSLERETRRDQRLEREAHDTAVAGVGDRFEVPEPVADIGVNPFQEGRDVQFELPADHLLRAAAAARNRVPSAAAAAGSVASQASVAAFGRVHRRTLKDMALGEVIVHKTVEFLVRRFSWLIALLLPWYYL